MVENKNNDVNGKKSSKLFMGLGIGGLGGFIAGVLVMGLFSVLFMQVKFGTGSDTVSERAKMNEIEKIVDENFALEYDESDLVESKYAGYVYGLDDPYSVYLTEESYAKMMESTNGEYVGIGVGVSPEPDKNTILINQVFTNSPAEKAGLQIGDEIVKVEGELVYGDKMDDAITKIKGKEGTSVVLTIYEKKTGDLKDITVERDSVIVDTVFSEVLDDNIGYIRIASFDAVTDEQFEEAYDNLINQNVKGLVLDLRNNPGGLLDVVCNIADIFVPEGNIVYTEDVNGDREYAKSDASKIEIPLQVLVNGNSASASEVLSGAIKDYGVGELVGEKTFGKGIVQRIFKLKDGSAVKLTIAKYYTPSGVCINGIGIEPDYEVVLDEESTINLFRNFDRSYDTQLAKAVENINNKTK